MKISLKPIAITVTLTLFTVLPLSILATPQRLISLSKNARGQGTITVGRETMKIGTVVVNLREDATGEITLVADLQIFINCTWSAPDDLRKGIDLKVTGGTTSSGASGSGKLFLRADGQSIASLSIEGSSNTSNRKIKVNFAAE